MRQDFVLAEKTIKQRYLFLGIILAVILVNAVQLSRTSLIDWDEGVFALQGKWFASLGLHGKPYNFQTPPLYQILIAGLFSIFGYKAHILHLIALSASCISLYFLFRIARFVLSVNDALMAVLFFTTTEYFMFFSRSGLSEALFLFFFLGAVLFFLKGINEKKSIDFIKTGLFIALALYTKYSAFPLFLSFLIIGLLNRRDLPKTWFLYCLLLPAVVYIPYLLLMWKFIGMREINTRYFDFLGFNHLKFISYLVIFAPSIVMISLAYVLTNIRKLSETDKHVFIIIGVFFIMLGFYYPFFRLAYPIVPLLAIPGARFITTFNKYKSGFALVLVVIAAMSSFKTMTYSNTIPEFTAERVRSIAEQEHVEYIYTVIPPNILFYIDYEILIPQGHPWERAGQIIPYFNDQKGIMNPDSIGLSAVSKTMIVHATALDDVRRQYQDLYANVSLVSAYHFNDAPVYYKDLFNAQRDIPQWYEIYLVDNAGLGGHMRDLWLFGFDRRVTVMQR